MSSLGVMFARLRGLFGRKRLEAELDDEVRFHLQMQIDDNVASGMSIDEARYAALRSFGAVRRIRQRSFHVQTADGLSCCLRRSRVLPRNGECVSASGSRPLWFLSVRRRHWCDRARR